MRIVSLQCPHCGATLDADAAAQTITCSYCGTSSHVRRRTGFFERVEPPPPLPASSAGQRGAQAPQVVIQPHTRRYIARMFIIPAVLGIGGTVFAFVMSQMAQDRAAKIQNEAQARAEANANATSVNAKARANHAAAKASASAAAAEPEARPPSWQGHGPPFVYDVDGDGDLEVLGRLRATGGSDEITLGALDGVSGEIVWQSDVLGTYEETYRAPVYLAGDALLAADTGGVLSAYAATDGATRWSLSLGERLDRLCAGPAGSIIATTADRERHRIDLAAGTADAAGRARCQGPLPSDDRDSLGQGVAKAGVRWTGRLRKAAGMQQWRALVRDGGDAVIVAGTKSPGTRVPMIARYQRGGGDPIAWTSVVPDGDPLKAETGNPELFTLSDDAAIAVYHVEDGVRLTAFEIDGGARRWDVAWAQRGPGSPGPFTGIVAGDTHVYVSTWGTLQAYALADGAHAFTLGW